MNKALAHVIKSDDQWYEHLLEDHLTDVAKLAREFAAPGDQHWLDMAGRWHDLGKYQERWQHYLKDKTGYHPDAHIEETARVLHSTAGAMHAVKTLGNGFGHILAYLIAGHHAGLTDWNTANAGRGSLKYRLESSEQEYMEAMAARPSEYILTPSEISLPKVAQSSTSIALWMRMLFSCLVDADFLDTEEFMDKSKAAQRNKRPSLNELRMRFELKMKELKSKASNTELNKIRNRVFKSCLEAAKWPPGLFSLTVPTGGGKTLSSLAFALEHAKIHNKNRIIYAIPFTSIIEQNADVFRKFVGQEGVLEHHSNLDVVPDQENRYTRLAAENWDAPLIVTTNVQLFESLHAARPSRCRKLHNIRNSVIVLDEAQQLPRDFHEPITQVMQQLTDNYGVTWVLCTATQPDLTHQQDAFGKTLLGGLSNVREIIDNPAEMVKQLKRVEIKLPTLDDPSMSWPDLAQQLQEEECVLAIVNTRLQARTLFRLLPSSDNNFHLSANMCAEHRTKILSQIKERLKKRKRGDTRPLRVISTQLIEAGVDVDFPVVYRAMAGLDSIAQSAGRCNREGGLPMLGRVIVFKTPERAPMGFLRQGEDTTIELIKGGKLAEPLSPESFSDYFKSLNSKGDRDKYNIIKLQTAEQSGDAPLSISFRSVSEKFRLIDNNGVAVIVPYCLNNEQDSPVNQWIAQLESDPSAKWVYKKLQRYTVTMPERFAKELQACHCLEQRAGLLVLRSTYNPAWGVESPETLLSAEASVV